MPLVFIPTVIFPFVFSKLIVFQILIGLTFPAYLALAWMEPKHRPSKSALYIAIAAYLGAVLLSVLFSVDIHRSWWGNQERMNGLFTVLHFFAWLTMAVGTIKRWEGWRNLLRYEVVLSVVMAFVAIFQRLNPRLLVFEAGERVGGLLDNPIYMGTYQMFNLAFLTLLFLKTKNKIERILYAVAALIDLVAFFLTQSRGALFGLGAVIGTFAIYYALFTPSKRARFSILGGALGAFGLYLAAFALRAMPFIANHPILSRLTNLQATTETRLIAWDIAWKGFLERPLFGWGFDAFHVLFNAKYNPKSLEFGYYETWFDRAHNTIMDVLSMTGLIGFVTFISIFVVIIALTWKARKKGWVDLVTASIITSLTVGYFFQNLFVFDHPASFSMSYLLFAFTIAATRPEFTGVREEASGETAKEPKAHSAPWMTFGLVQIIMLVVVWNCSLLPFQASAMAIRANGLLNTSRLDEGFELLQKSIETSNLYNGEQSFLMSRAIVAMAESGSFSSYPKWREAYEQAKAMNDAYIARHPKDTNSVYIYARMVHAMLAYLKPEEAQEAIVLSERLYLQSIDSSPKRQQLYYGLARLYAQVGQIEKTRETLKKAVDFNENIGESWWYYGLVSWLDLGKEAEGTQAVVRAMTAKSKFIPQRVADVMQIARAAQIQKNTDLLRSTMDMISGLSGGGSVDQYLAIAKIMEAEGLIEERNKILNSLASKVPDLVQKLKPLASGVVQTIDESFALASSTATVTAVSSTQGE